MRAAAQKVPQETQSACGVLEGDVHREIERAVENTAREGRLSERERAVLSRWLDRHTKERTLTADELAAIARAITD